MSAYTSDGPRSGVGSWAEPTGGSYLVPLGSIVESLGRVGTMLRKVVDRVQSWGRRAVGTTDPAGTSIEIGTLRMTGGPRHGRYLRKVAAGRAEPLMLRLFHEQLQPGRDVIDVGAYLGLYAITAARSGTVGRVWAFEPDPRNFPHLRTNVEANAVAVECHELVVSDRAGTTGLHLAGRGQSGTRVSAGGELRARCVALDGFLPEEADPGVVKLDVEGHEVAALEGMRGLIERSRPTLFVECHPAGLRRQGSSEAALKTLLAGFGYRLDAIDEPRGRLMPAQEWSGGKYVNLLCSPAARSPAG